MLGWFKSKTPACPLELYQKVWVEKNMLWLAQGLGIERLRRATVLLPTAEYFPDKYNGTKLDVRLLFQFLGRHLQIDTDSIDLQIADLAANAEYRRNPDGVVIYVSAAVLEDVQLLLAVLSRELCNHLLMEAKMLEFGGDHDEGVVDLAMAYLGVAVFAANTALKSETGYVGVWSWWQIAKWGKLPAHVLGYAMALFAFMRGEDAAWDCHLRGDAQDALRTGLTFLCKTGDTLFHPDTIGTDSSNITTMDDRIRALTHGSSTVRLSCLWDMHEGGNPDVILSAAVTQCLGDANDATLALAVRVLAMMKILPGGNSDLLVKLLWHHSSALVRAAAAHALGTLKPDPKHTIECLGFCLTERHLELLAETCAALGNFGRAARGQLPKILEALPVAFRHGDHAAIDALLGAIEKIAANPKLLLRDEFGDDPELYEHFLNELMVRRSSELKGDEFMQMGNEAP